MFDDSYYDEIELEYSCFLAEQELFENLLYLGSNVYHESMGLIVIQEDFSTTITKYMDKIVIGIQKAWNNFKNKVIGFASKPILDNSKDKIGTYKDGNITTENWHVYDMNKFDALKMVPFDLKQLEPFQNKTDYYASVYSGFFTDKNKSLKENIIDSIMRTEDKHDVKINDIQEVYAFCSTGFKENTTKLDADLDAFNASINAVKSAVNITTSGEETSGENQTETSPTAQQSNYKLKEESANMLLEFYNENNLLLEGPGDDKNNNSQKIINNDKGTPQQKNQIAKIQWYFSGNTNVFSAKMKILRKKYLDGINLLKAAFPKSKETDNTSKTGEKVEYKLKTEKQPLQIKK